MRDQTHEEFIERWGEFVKKQLEGYLPIISGSRMAADYLRKGYPTVAAAKEEEAA